MKNILFIKNAKEKTDDLSHFHTKHTENFKLDMETETQYTVQMFFTSTV